MKNIITETGITTISVQKSGCNQTSNTTIPSIQANGKNPFLKSCKYALYLLKKNARKIMILNLRNSVGCIVNGIHGILIHQEAHFKLIHISKTITNKINTNQKICLEYFLNNL
jgi:hypothetical protein